MNKRASSLAKELELNSSYDYYNYIVESLINGNRSQVKELFNAMHNEDKEYFLINFIDSSQGYHVSTRNICIGELCS